MTKYKTKPSQLLLDFLAKHPDEQFTVNEIAERLGDDSPALSTIYRNLCELEADGEVSRAAVPGRRENCFRYVGAPECLRCLHMRCKNCGGITHVHESVARRILNILSEEEGFETDISQTVFTGLCSSCRKKT